MGIKFRDKEWSMQRFRERCSHDAIRMIWLAEHKSEEAADAVIWLQKCELSFRTTMDKKDFYDSIKTVLGLTELFPEICPDGAITEFVEVMRRVWENDELDGILR